ncbi:hypothetical protein SAMN06297387_108146 [Streptomyces zhaozhouensis]|uniref:Secreted protein n=1 Tax=Streptomyces zhaozhouensis TaxID=1300267 RepID=A0A286DWH8_9ACTN|nr:hypothetical protein [Streptomyces zhaozhouensis]SOD62983.1 hypothetical protein SAMN06297387_108146 [Streptomyces zhaozhouensis]
MSPRAPRRRPVAATGLLAALALAAGLSAAPPAAADPAPAADTWSEVGSDRADPLTESQGLASVEVPANSANRYTGIGTIPFDVRTRGWNHVGDPDASYDGHYIEPYQRDDGDTKMYRVQDPSGDWAEYVHRLGPDEVLNNSWVAISPDGRWMLSGEWGTMDRFLVFPTPGVHPDTSPSEDLPQVATVHLDRPVRDVQGCDFRDATTLLCSSDDPEGSLFGTTKPLLQVDLAAALDGGDVDGNVTALRQLPLRSACSGAYEAQGVDYDRRTGTLRVIVMSPGACVVVDSMTYRLTRD